MDGQFVRLGRQEVATFAEDDHLEMEFNGVSLGQEDWTEIKFGNGAGFEVEHPGQLLRRIVE